LSTTLRSIVDAFRARYFHPVVVSLVKRNISRATILLAVGMSSWPMPALPDVLDRYAIFDIAPQPFADAVLEFGKQARLQITIVGESADLQSPAVKGRQSSRTALLHLLDNTGMSFRVVDRSVIISLEEPEAEPQASSLDTYLVPLGGPLVTGTSIRASNLAISEIVGLDATVMQGSEYATVADLIRSLPQGFGNGSIGYVNFDRRALAAATLLPRIDMPQSLMLNGRLLSFSGLDPGVFDAYTIPLAATARIEAVTGPTAAIHGDTAPSGVVNFIMRDDYEGAETRARIGSATSGSMREAGFSQLLGERWSSGKLLVCYDFFHRDPIPAAQHLVNEQNLDAELNLWSEQLRHSGFLSVSQSIGNAATLFFDALYTRRFEGAKSDGQTVTPQTQIDALNAAATARVRHLGRWELTTSLSYIHEHVSREQASLVNRFDTTGANIAVDGPLFPAPGGQASVAVGADYRVEHSYSLTHPFDATLANVAEERDRAVTAVFTEIPVPIVSYRNRLPGIERLALSLAARYVDYDDYGSKVLSRLGMEWSPFHNVTVHGESGRSFKAPYLANLDESGNAGLEAESASTWTAGVRWEAEWNFDTTLDLSYLDIEYSDRIQVVDGRYVNTSAARSRALSLTASTATDSKWGRFALDADVSYLLEYTGTQTSGAAPLQLLDTVDNPLRFRMWSRLSWLLANGLSADLTMLHAASYRDPWSTPAHDVGSWTSYDLGVSYETAAAEGWTAGCTLSLNVLNLFGTSPPFANNPGTGYDSENADRIDRFVNLQIRKEW
jgi:outer membrane receptor protein involved in Fe transport